MAFQSQNTIAAAQFTGVPSLKVLKVNNNPGLVGMPNTKTARTVQECTHLSIHTRRHAVQTCKRMHICTCIYVHIYVHSQACKHLCMRLCMCQRARIHARFCTRMCMHVCAGVEYEWTSPDNCSNPLPSCSKLNGWKHGDSTHRCCKKLPMFPSGKCCKSLPEFLEQERDASGKTSWST